MMVVNERLHAVDVTEEHAREAKLWVPKRFVYEIEAVQKRRIVVQTRRSISGELM